MNGALFLLSTSFQLLVLSGLALGRPPGRMRYRDGVGVGECERIAAEGEGVTWDVGGVRGKGCAGMTRGV